MIAIAQTYNVDHGLHWEWALALYSLAFWVARTARLPALRASDEPL